MIPPDDVVLPEAPELFRAFASMMKLSVDAGDGFAPFFLPATEKRPAIGLVGFVGTERCVLAEKALRLSGAFNFELPKAGETGNSGVVKP